MREPSTAWPRRFGREIALVLMLAALLLALRKPLGAFLASAVGLLGIIATPGLAMFPFMMPSSSEPRGRASRCGTPRQAR